MLKHTKRQVNEFVFQNAFYCHVCHRSLKEEGRRKSEVGSRKKEVGSRKSLLGFRKSYTWEVV